jgi:hypothetical protein
MQLYNVHSCHQYSISKKSFLYFLQDPCQPFIPFLKHQEEKYKYDFKNYDEAKTVLKNRTTWRRISKRQKDN